MGRYRRHIGGIAFGGQLMTESQFGEREARQAEVDRNYAVFREMLPDLLADHAGRFALLRHGEVVEYFDSVRDAAVVAFKAYADGLFSVQRVSENAADLGYFSHAVHDRGI